MLFLWVLCDMLVLFDYYQLMTNEFQYSDDLDHADI